LLLREGFFIVKESIREKGDWLLFRFLKKVPVPFFMSPFLCALKQQSGKSKALDTWMAQGLK